MIRAATEVDVDRLVEIHASALPGDLLPRLGRPFLRNIFFPCALQSSNTLTLVNVCKASVQAFVVFALNGAAFTAELKKARVAIVLALLTRGLRDPRLFLEAATLIRGGRISLNRPIEHLAELPELYLIATHPSAQGRGLGSELVGHGLTMLAQKRVGMCVVRTSAPRARTFYQSLQFEDLGMETRGRRQLFLLGRPI